MMAKKTSFLKTVMLFSISPGFSGIFLLLISSSQDFSEIIQKPLYFIESVFQIIILGFFGGILFYITPAFILGLIYATMKLKKSWKSYSFITLFSPAFLFISNYLLMENTAIPGWAKVDHRALITLMCPLSSFSSLIAAWLSLPPKNKTSTTE